MVGRLISLWDGLFSGAMLVSGRVSPLKNGGYFLPTAAIFDRKIFIAGEFGGR